MFDLRQLEQLVAIAEQGTLSAAALPDRVDVPILDPEASITFWLCALRKNRKLLEHVPDMTGESCKCGADSISVCSAFFVIPFYFSFKPSLNASPTLPPTR